MMKKKSGKRFLSWLLAAVMIITLMPANAFAEPPAESSGNTETPVTFCCPDSEGGTDVSVGGYDSSTTAETLFKDISSDVLSFDADSVEDSLKEGTIQETNTPVRLDKAVVLADDNVPKTQEDLAKEGTEISAVIKTDNDITYLPAEGGNPVSLGGDQSLVILYTPQETPSDADADNRDAETKDTPADEPAKESPVADKATEGAPAQEGAVNSTDEKIPEDSTKEVSAAELAGLTAMLGAPVPMEIYAWQSYPVYVYGCFKHNGKNLDKNAALYINGRAKAIEWNGDASKGEYYITFGKLTDATDKNPFHYTGYSSGEVPEWQIPTSDIEKRIAKGDVILASESTTGSAQKNGLATTGEDVNKYVDGNWSGLKPRKGAEGFSSETGTRWSWHIDGTIDVYRVSYTRGTLPKNEEFTPPKESTYFLDDYTVRGQKPTSKNYKFTGWAYNGEIYNQGDKVPASKTDITLEAQWAPKEKVYTVNYAWDGSIPSDLSTPSLPNPNKFTSMDDVRAAKDTTYVKDYTHTTTDGTYTFSGWTPSVGTTDYSGDEIVTPITFTGTWTFKAKPITNYKVAYKWAGDIPSNAGNPPTDDKDYSSPEAVQAAVDGMDTSNFTSSEPKDNVAGTWRFDKWEKSSSSDSVTGHVTTTTITYTGTWKFTPNPVTIYKVAYKWAGDIPSDAGNPPTDDKDYTSPEAVQAAVDGMDTSSFTSSKPNKDNVAGTWRFDKWEKSSSSDSVTGHVTTTTITYTGTWKFTPNPVTIYKVAYKWAGDIPSDAGNPPTDDKDYTSPEAVQAAVDGMDTSSFTSSKPNKDNVAGTWKFDKWKESSRSSSTVGHVTTITITYIGSWNFTPSEIKTITGVLNGLVQKDFKAQYNYSTEGTFTATAEVMVMPRPEAISYTAEVDVPSDNNTNTPGTDNTKTFTGTVTLKTGETKFFTFSAKETADDVLEPNTRYAVRVSEVEGNLSKVTYDTTKYILGFETDGNAVVDDIWIAKIVKDQDNEEAFPELAPMEDGKPITFQNIYTYKRHHSSDNGNGGGKKEEKPTVEIKDDDALGLNNTDHFAYIVGYGNGEVRPQNSITRAEVAAIFFRLLEDDVRDANYTRQNKFTDVSNDAWYCSAVSTLSAMGIISGYPDATFRPNASITRAEFAAIATRFDVNGDKTPASFNDIAGHWAKDEIAVAANNGWVNGYEDGSFRPQNKITRAETMSLVNRVLNRKPETAEDLLENMTKWTDNADTNAWYYLAVQEATNSHYYEYKENSQYEKWTELRETRDWSELDK